MSVNSKDDRIAAQILIVEDEEEHADVMAEALRKPGHVCTIVNGVLAALDELKGGTFDVIVTDLRMPTSAGTHGVAPDGADAGLRVLESARRLQPQAETIMVTAHGDVPTARAAFKLGVYDFIEKPLDLDVFRNLVNRAAETVLLRHESASGAEELVQHQGFEGIIAGSEAMRKILRTVKTIAPSNIPVLITGESGTGKELIAQAVHKNSKRSQQKFIAFNCAGQSESLLEDTLFGHVRGAFTGADKDRPGYFEAANGGTLFLDELGDMPLAMQAKLLRVLESGEVVRLGSNDPRHTDVRFVSATNKDLKAISAEGRFREDLYFRINGAHIHIPPLRERREDIPRIIQHVATKFVEQNFPASQIPELTDAAMMRLTSYSWPGNVRQLKTVIHNMVATAIGEDAPPGQPLRLDVRHIPDDVRTSDPGDDDPDSPTHPGSAAAGGALAGTSLEQIEKRAIRETLGLTNGNREHAAKLLGIGERTLYRKLKEYGLR